MEIVQSEQGTQIKLQIPTEVLRALSAERLRAARKRADDDPLNATR
jgi:transcriptional regulator of met regulon